MNHTLPAEKQRKVDPKINGHNHHKSPDIRKLQEIRIDAKTCIYVKKGIDPVKAAENWHKRNPNYI